MSLTMTRRTLLSAAAAAVAAVGLATGAAAPALADEYGKAEDAIALVGKAVAYAAKVGRDAAVETFNKPDNEFRDRDLYVFVARLEDGVRVAHPLNPKLVGKALPGTKDIDGKPYGDEIMELAKGKGEGWVDYMYSDPTTKKLAPKSTYVKVADGLIFLCGIYKR